MKIYIGNISRESTEDEVKELFSKFGEIENFKLIRDINTDQLKGFGFVDMPNDEEANKAINELNGSNFKERPLTVSVANPNAADRKKKPAGKGKTGGGGYGKSTGGGYGKSSGGGYGKSSGGGYGKSSGGGYGKSRDGGQNKENNFNRGGNKSGGNGNVNGNREGGNDVGGFNYNHYK